MVELKLPSLRTALSQAWGELRSAIGLPAPPPETSAPDADHFIARLEHVLEHELAPASPQPKRLLLKAPADTPVQLPEPPPAPALVIDSAPAPEAIPEYSFNTTMVPPRRRAFDPILQAASEPVAQPPVIESTPAPEAFPEYSFNTTMVPPRRNIFDPIPEAVPEPVIQAIQEPEFEYPPEFEDDAAFEAAIARDMPSSPFVDSIPDAVSEPAFQANQTPALESASEFEFDPEFEALIAMDLPSEPVLDPIPASIPEPAAQAIQAFAFDHPPELFGHAPEFEFDSAFEASVAPALPPSPVFDPIPGTVPELTAQAIQAPAIEHLPASEEVPEVEAAIAAAPLPLAVFDPVPDTVSEPAAQAPQTPSIEPSPAPRRGRKSSSEGTARPSEKRSKKPVRNPEADSANDGAPSAPKRARKTAVLAAANTTSPLDPITVTIPQQNGADQNGSPKPASRRKRQAPAPRATLESTAMAHVPQVKPVDAANGFTVKVTRLDLPLADLHNVEQSATVAYQHAPEQLQAQALAGQVPPKQKKNDSNDDSSPFSVSVGQVYDGPLDLLLDLIRRQDIDIYDIPIATITAQFLSYVNQLKATDVDVAGEFIYTASLLIHIKSKMLLPRSPAGPDEASEDPRRELVERLLEHERFKNAAQMLQQKQMLEAATWSNPGFREFQDDLAAEPEIAADTTDLVRIFRDILERARKRPVLDLQEDSATVGQMIQFLARRLSIEDKPVALRRLLSGTRSEKALVAIFLALLELVRLQAILLRQDRAFSEIFIKKSTGFDAVMNEGLTNAQDDWR